MARVKLFELGEEDLSVDFGTYALLMYYASEVNQSKAIKLFDATLTEWQYRRRNNLPFDEYTSSDFRGHFVISDIVQSIEFIEDQLIPALENETGDLLAKYGGRGSFRNIVNANAGFIGALGIEEDEFYYDDPPAVAGTALSLKEFFQYVISMNQRYYVYIN